MINIWGHDPMCVCILDTVLLLDTFDPTLNSVRMSRTTIGPYLDMVVMFINYMTHIGLYPVQNCKIVQV